MNIVLKLFLKVASLTTDVSANSAKLERDGIAASEKSRDFWYSSASAPYKIAEIGRRVKWGDATGADYASGLCAHPERPPPSGSRMF
jgi:hypothetical protein